MVDDHAGQATDLNEFLGSPPQTKRRRYFKIAAIVVVVAALVLLVAQCFKPDEAGALLTQDVTRGDIKITVTATGTLKPTNEVQVGSEQSGIITAVFVNNNAAVVRGQPLARLDTSRLSDAIAQSRAALNLAVAQVDQARAGAQAAQLKLGRLENTYRISGGAVPARADIDYARTDRDRATATVREAQARVVQARAQLSSAQTDLGKATIFSPVTGVVLSRKIDPGQTVAASFQAPVLFTIAESLSVMKLEVQVDEADVGLVEAGQVARFTVDAYPGERFEARVERVDIGAREAGSAGAGGSGEGGSASRVVSYTAVLSVQNSAGKLRPGMTATATIDARIARDQLLVPNAALRFKPEEKKAGGLIDMGGPSEPPQTVGINRGASGTVYVLGADPKPQPRRITVGLSDGVHTSITAGTLKIGERVVVGQLAPGVAAPAPSAAPGKPDG